MLFNSHVVFKCLSVNKYEDNNSNNKYYDKYYFPTVISNIT